jgi:hypothetical protein
VGRDRCGRGAPPGGRGRDRPGFRAGRERLELEQPGELGFEAAEAVQFGPDLGEALPQEGLGVAAGAQALVGDLEQLADLPQPQPGPLGPFDQPQASDRVLVVQAVAGRGPGRWREQADPFVVADGVGAEPAWSARAETVRAMPRG